MRPVDHHSGLPGLPNSQPLPCGDDPALRTSRGESHPAREARSVRHGEGKTPRSVRVITRRDGLSGAQTKSHTGHVPPTHRPRSPEQMGVPCAHGRDPAGDETDSALGTQGLAISAFPITCAGTNVRARTHFAIPMPRDRSVFSMLLRPSFSSSRIARIASMFSGTTSDSWWTAWK